MRRRSLTPHQKAELESCLGEAVEFLLGPRALLLSQADRLIFCATLLLSKLGESAPPPQPLQSALREVSSDSLRVANELRCAFEEALAAALHGDPDELPIRGVARSLLEKSMKVERSVQ